MVSNNYTVAVFQFLLSTDNTFSHVSGKINCDIRDTTYDSYDETFSLCQGKQTVIFVTQVVIFLVHVVLLLSVEIPTIKLIPMK